MLDESTQAAGDLRLGSPPRLAILHAVVFTLGFFMCTASVIGSNAELAVAGGTCLMVSAVLSWLGLKVELSGTVGRVLRASLGPMPNVKYHARTAVWFAVGLAMTTWGAWNLLKPQAHDQELPPPANLSAK